MHKSSWKQAAMAALMLVVAAAAVPAQTKVAARVKIPFAFEAGNQSLAAGEYRVERDAGVGGPLYLYDVERNHMVMVAATPGRVTDREATPKLVFQRAGTSYCLTEVGVGASQATWRVAMTKEQAALAKNGPGKRIEIALVRR